MGKARILQLTDLHVFADPGRRLKGIPTRECLEELVEWLQTQQAPFDYVIVTGDHTHEEELPSYEAVRKILSPWADRLWQVPGNHDDRTLLRSVFPSIDEGKPSDLINFSFGCGSWHFLGLDTHVPGAVAGDMSAAQISWLQQKLAETNETRIGLFLHHPPVDVGSQWMDAIGLQGKEQLQDLIRSDERIGLVCCGHVHHEFEARVGQAQVFTTPSTGIQFDPVGTSPQFAAEAPGCRVIEVDGPHFTTQVLRLPEVRYTPVNE